MSQKNVGLFLGRFQPFHNAHKEIILQSFNFVDFLIIGIGSSQYSLAKENPFNYYERRQMIETHFRGDANMKVMPIPDIHDPENYVEYVKKLTSDTPFNVVFTDNQDTIDLFKEKGYPIVIIPIPGCLHGTAIRESFYRDDGIWRKYVPASTEFIMDLSRKKDIT